MYMYMYIEFRVATHGGLSLTHDFVLHGHLSMTYTVCKLLHVLCNLTTLNCGTWYIVHVHMYMGTYPGVSPMHPFGTVGHVHMYARENYSKVWLISACAYHSQW